jgi:AbrB family looped-hinge helix DNA binding protein
MALVKMLRGGMLTLPAEIRRSLRLGDGDYLEAEVVDGKVELRPVAVVDRQEAWRKIREAQASVRYIGPEPRPSPEEEEQWIFDVLAEERDRRA